MIQGQRVEKKLQADRGAMAAAIRARAAALHLDGIRFTGATLPAEVGRRYRAALAAGQQGSMDWLAREPERRSSPDRLWPAARTAIVCGLNYGPGHDPLPELQRHDRGYLSVYARHRDYHDVLKGRLKELAGWLAARFQAEVKVFVDTAPLLEKPLAQQAGLGWQGKHSNLVSRDLGSWLFLGEILTDLDLPHDAPECDHCGSCRRCLDVCPTDAFPSAYRLDARRCISYLTIEHQGHDRSAELRPLMGNRIYGCDDCLAVCPWNKYAQRHRADAEAAGARGPGLHRHWPSWRRSTMPAFRRRFAGSPVKRIGRDRFVRNVLIAIGNSGDARPCWPRSEPLLDDAAPRWCAAWRDLGLVAACPDRADAPPPRTAACRRRTRRRCPRRNGRRHYRERHPCSASASATRRKRAGAAARRRKGWEIRGTTRRSDKASEPGTAAGWQMPSCSIALASAAGRGARMASRHVLTSIAPDDAGDPVLDLHGAQLLANCLRWSWAGYLGTTAVYGDHQGGWVDEDTAIEPTLARADRRARAEAAWLANPACRCRSSASPASMVRGAMRS